MVPVNRLLSSSWQGFLQDKGEVRVYGVSNRSKKIHSLVKFVLESGQVYSYLTAMENLQYFLSLNGIALSHIKAEVDVLCDQLAFTPYKDTLVSELSQGNRQKLTLILALVQKPKVLCLDEPTNGLDLLAKTADDSFAGLCSSPSSQYFYHQS